MRIEDSPALPPLHYPKGFISCYDALRNSKHPWSAATKRVSPDIKGVVLAMNLFTRNPNQWNWEAVRIVPAKDTTEYSSVYLSFVSPDPAGLPNFSEPWLVRLLGRSPRIFLDLPRIFKTETVENPSLETYKRDRLAGNPWRGLTFKASQYADGYKLGRFRTKNASGLAELRLYIDSMYVYPFYLHTSRSVMPDFGIEDPIRFVVGLRLGDYVPELRYKGGSFLRDIGILGELIEEVEKKGLSSIRGQSLGDLQLREALLQEKGPTFSERIYLMLATRLRNAPTGLEPEGSDNYTGLQLG